MHSSIWEGEKDLFFLVLNVFPSCSQSVPNSTLVLFHLVLPKVQFPCIQIEKVGYGPRNTFVSNFEWGSKEVLPLGSCLTVLKQLMMSRWTWVLQKNKKVMKTPMNYLIWITIGLNMCIYSSHEIGLVLHVLSNN
jgi:hypothetical protein